MPDVYNPLSSYLVISTINPLPSKKVITWDIPLHGESRPYEGFTLDHAADELKRILDAEGILHVILAGQSAGGYVAQAFVRAYPDMVTAFIGIDTTPFGKEYYSKTDLFWISRYTDIARLYPYGYYCRMASRSATYTEEAETSFRDSLQKLGRQGMITAARSVYADFLRNEEPVRFPCPVFLMMGEHDKTGLVRRYNQQWAEKCGFPLHILEDAAHNANYDNYQEFNDAMLAFLAGNGCALS